MRKERGKKRQNYAAEESGEREREHGQRVISGFAERKRERGVARNCCKIGEDKRRRETRGQGEPGRNCGKKREKKKDRKKPTTE